MADTDNRALEAFETFMKTEAPSDYDASNGDAWYVWKACWAAALASRPAEVDDSQLRNVAQFLLDRYDELRNKKGAPSTAEFELLRLALAPSHTTNKEK